MTKHTVTISVDAAHGARYALEKEALQWQQMAARAHQHTRTMYQAGNYDAATQHQTTAARCHHYAAQAVAGHREFETALYPWRYTG